MENFYYGKRVFITGHTGFKGSYLSKILLMMGAEVTGYALNPPTDDNLFDLLGLQNQMKSVIGDVRDFSHLNTEMKAAQPDVVFHLAAQPLVIDSYRNPRYTYETNVMGTVNFLEAAKMCSAIGSILNVTTDKVYLNNEWSWGYRETDALDGYDPYSNSKSCSELVTHSYTKSFFREAGIAVSTARAGNVIGGGDFAENRIIPDCVRAAAAGKTIEVRNPNSIRPYQHVFEPLHAYLTIAQRQYEHSEFAGSYNIGPRYEDCVTTGELVTAFCECWGDQQSWSSVDKNGPHEANFLKLDCSLIKDKLGWTPKWNYKQAVEKTVEWSKNWLAGNDVGACVEEQIKMYF